MDLFRYHGFPLLDEVGVFLPALVISWITRIPLLLYPGARVLSGFDADGLTAPPYSRLWYADVGYAFGAVFF